MTGDRLEPGSTAKDAGESRKQFGLLQSSNKCKQGSRPECQSIRQTNLMRGRQGNPRSERLAGWSETGRQEHRVTGYWKAR